MPADPHYCRDCPLTFPSFALAREHATASGHCVTWMSEYAHKFAEFRHLITWVWKHV
jgi:hypothetical protein